MLLSKALRLDCAPRLAIVGAGGKTSALFRLGRELLDRQLASGAGRGDQQKTVLLTATTHLAVEQLEWADHHYIIRSPGDILPLENELPGGLVLLTGPSVQDGRTKGLDLDVMERLLGLAESCQIPLLVEADGSRRKPLKAPAEYEPVLPPWVDTVLVVAGLSALGKPLNQDWVHRTELFAKLAGLSLGSTLDVESITRVLVDPKGGLKDIPPAARRVVLLNQADTGKQQAAAYGITEDLLGAYQAVVIASLAPGAFDKIQPTTIPEPVVFAAHEHVAGIILAAGESSRMGRSKQLLEWRGEPFIHHITRTALRAGLSPVIVVTGYADREVRTALEGLPIVLTHNPDWNAGQSHSVIAGLSALPKGAGAAVFLLADQPHVPVGLIRGLVEQHTQSLAPVIAPLVDGRRSNPVLFDRVTFPDLFDITGDVGGRALFSRYPVSWLPWFDARVALDVDTAGDYASLLEYDEI